jgi:N-carbamoylputrescine amidase
MKAIKRESKYSKVIRIAAVQHSRAIGDIEYNLENMWKWSVQAANEGAQIVAFPELSNVGYICCGANDDFFDLAEVIPGDTTNYYLKIAKELNIHLVAGLYERDPISHSYYNSAVIVGPKGLIGRYRKRHIPSKPTFLEKYYFSPGNLGYPVFDLGFCRVGITICYDRHFPECYRHMALNGAEIVFSINNTGSTHSIRVWDSIMSCNAYCNGIFVVQVNAIGKEGENFLHGQSAIVNPFGEFSAHAEAEEQLIIADCDLSIMQAARKNLGSVRDVVWADFGLEDRQKAHFFHQEER